MERKQKSSAQRNREIIAEKVIFFMRSGSMIVFLLLAVTSMNIARSVGSVGALTFVCKLLGLLRQMMIAAKFGVGWVRDLTSSSHFSALILTRQLESSSLQIVDSHNQASVIPSFFLIASARRTRRSIQQKLYHTWTLSCNLLNFPITL